jgi:WD40 repeat protein
LERAFGGSRTQHRGFVNDSCSDPLDSTRDFASSENDSYRHQRRNLAFSVAACNTNSLVGISTESGKVALVDTDPSAPFNKSHLLLRLLQNAITDLSFSPNDNRLVVGCGDKTVRLVDMQTQKTLTMFSGHTGCLKQVRFQPTDDNIIASSCREGIVNLWDARCRGESKPVWTQVAPGDPRDGAQLQTHEYRAECQTEPIRRWERAHSDRLNMIRMNEGPKALR